ncbi:hypothetical protein PTR77_26070, partial [Serratia bockelmannii]|uniref:hypothetical protein n=1 Tax=Serratia bockelmannii TaxID=2703793 RepID=UPI00313D466B
QTITLPDKPMALTILPNLHHVPGLYPMLSTRLLQTDGCIATFSVYTPVHLQSEQPEPQA